MADVFEYIALDGSDWFVPSTGYSKQASTRIKAIEFGDGYIQRTPNGINNTKYTWDLSFNNRRYEVINSMEAFLIDKKGSRHFLWTPPDELVEYTVVCSTWSSNVGSPIHKSLNCTFEQVFV
jgi:phage-related protein